MVASASTRTSSSSGRRRTGRIRCALKAATAPRIRTATRRRRIGAAARRRADRMDFGGTWPWLTLAGLGMFHGLNPAMGWLFAVALGLHRHSRQVVVVSLLPVALGHALSISLVAVSVMAMS